MILPDINLLIYAYNEADPDHARAKSWLETALQSSEPVCLIWHTIMGFIRITTSPRVFPRALRTQDAISIVDSLLRSPRSMILSPGNEHFRIFSKLANESGISGAKLADAHIAAIAIEHGATVASSDRDFRLFDGLKLINPLVQK